jgi:hypothetical protein
MYIEGNPKLGECEVNVGELPNEAIKIYLSKMSKWQPGEYYQTLLFWQFH